MGALQNTGTSERYNMRMQSFMSFVSNLGLSSHASATYSKSFDLCAPRRSHAHASFKNHVRLIKFTSSLPLAELFLVTFYICVTLT